jgi:hypothetical protein
MRHIYSILVSGPDDVPGALAYVAYKRMQIEWRAQFYATHSREPDVHELESFAQIQTLSANIESLRERGALIATEFLQEMLNEKMAELVVRVSQSELAQEFSTLNTNVTSSLQQIQTQLGEKKTIGGWMKDIGTAFVSSLALVAMVGAILTGYVGLAKLTASTERAVGIPAPNPVLKDPASTPLAPQEYD